MIFYVENLNIEVLVWIYLQSLVTKKIALKSTFARWIVMFDSSSFEFKVFESTCSVLTQLLVVYITSNHENSSNIVERGSILKLE